MIKEAIDRILGLAWVQTLTFGGREYTDKNIVPVKLPMPETLEAHTLTGLVDYIAANNAVEGFLGKNPFLHVVSHEEVRLLGASEGLFLQQPVFMEVEPPENGRFRFGNWMEVEPFIISLQAMFVPDENSKALLAFISSIKEANDRTSADDGISQTVTAKTGVALVTESKVPNPVTLRPYRTFMEVDQPEISCVFRLQKGPLLSLHEADGGQWRLQAIKSIKAYLEKALEDLSIKMTVIA